MFWASSILCSIFSFFFFCLSMWLNTYLYLHPGRYSLQSLHTTMPTDHGHEEHDYPSEWMWLLIAAAVDIHCFRSFHFVSATQFMYYTFSFYFFSLLISKSKCSEISYFNWSTTFWTDSVSSTFTRLEREQVTSTNTDKRCTGTLPHTQTHTHLKRIARVRARSHANTLGSRPPYNLSVSRFGK